jgi:hypothetical protein
MNSEIIKDEKYGVVLRIFDVERADSFEDFLVDNHSRTISVKFDPEYVSFYFGTAESISDIQKLYDIFEQQAR